MNPIQPLLRELNPGALTQPKHQKLLKTLPKTVEMGWPLGMPLVRSLGKGLWEVRSSFREGIARVIFKMVDQQMVLLHGFVKKSQKTPSQDMEIALRRAKMLEH